MQEAIKQYPLQVTCAIQWQRCIKAAAAALAKLPTEQVHTLRYEDFVHRPAEGLSAIMKFLGISATDEQIAASVEGVFAGSVGRWQAKIDDETAQAMMQQIGQTLKEFSYH